MDPRILEAPNIEHLDFRVIAVEGDFHQHNVPLDAKGKCSLSELLRPITDASHTRDRKRSPPDSACLPGTRKGVVKWIIIWASSSVLLRRQHILWVYGYAGCGKSAIAQEVSERVHSGGRLLATFFFFRGAGDRSKIGRLPNTLASQMAITLPETGPLIEAAAKAEPQLLEVESCLSLSARLQRLVYEPFKAVASKASLAKTLLSNPYLIIIDGLDECEDKEGVQEFIVATLTFFDQNPSLPLRILITSRVEQHIRSRLVTSGGVRLKDLGNHCTRKDIQKFMRIVFDAETKGNPIIQAHIRQNGSWPGKADSKKLVNHIGGSFIFASTLFKFIFQEPVSPNDHSTPLDRFPLALNIDPGLDGLYSQTLTRSAHLPFFTDVISTLALTAKPLPISGIAELLDIQASAVAHVLVDLQAIVQVPGTDDAPVNFYHTSLRDFLTTESRSGQLFVPRSFHARLLIGCLSCEVRARRQTPKVRLDRRKQTAAVQYSLEHRYTTHSYGVRYSFTSDNLKKIIQLRREQVELLPGDARPEEGLEDLAIELYSLFGHDGVASTIEEAVSMHREALSLRPHPHPDRHYSLNNLGNVLDSLFRHSQRVADIEEAISMHREALTLCPHPHPDRHHSLNNLGLALRSLFGHSQRVADIEEAILMLCEALSLRPHPHPDRHHSLNNLGLALDSLFGHSQHVADIEEAILMHREALSLRPHPHPDRHHSLNNLGNALDCLFGHSQRVADIEEAISMHREALSLRPHPHPDHHDSLNNLGVALHSLFGHSQRVADIEEAISMHCKALSLRPHPHPDRHSSLNNLGLALDCLFGHSQRVADIEEAISMHREALSLRPHPHPDRHRSLNRLGNALYSLFGHSQRVADIEEAISMHREALSLRPHPHPHRHHSLNNLGLALYSLFGHSQCVADIEEAISMYCEALSLRPHPHPYRHDSLGGLGLALDSLFEHSQCVADIEEAISMHREALSLRPHPHLDRHYSLGGLGDAIKRLCEHRRKVASPQSPTDLDEAIACTRELLVEHYIEGHNRRDLTQDKLQSLLQLRAEMSGNQGDLDEIER